MQLDSFTYTILFILAITLLASFTRRKRRDRCLRYFSGSPVTLERINGEITAKGILKVESTGLELKYPKKIERSATIIESSFIFYKYEFDQIQAIIRYEEELSPLAKEKRLKTLAKISRKTFSKKIGRIFLSLFKIIKDSLNEIVNAMALQFQKTSAGMVFKTQDNFVKKINTELLDSVGSAHEPLIEKYIGKTVVFDLIKDEKLYKYSGILKDYTTNFIQLMNVSYKTEEQDSPKLCDIIIPQKLGIIRHFGEIPVEKKFPLADELNNLNEKILNISFKKRKNEKENPIIEEIKK